MSVGFVVLSAALLAGAEPVTLSGPRLARGDELVYAGTVEETGERFDNRFKKKYQLDVRVFVLDVHAGGTDCGVMTTVQPLDDPLVQTAMVAAAGSDARREKPAPIVRLELIRVSDRGRVKVLAPKGTTPPLALDARTPTTDPLPPSTDAPPTVELGAFVPLPLGPAKLGGTWDAAEPGRPPLVWTAGGETVWNGRRCAELSAVQQTDGYDLPESTRHGWKRTDAVVLAAADGFASAVERTFVRREGRDRVGSVTVRYELQPANRHSGSKYTAVRAEVEAAWAFAAEHAASVRLRADELRSRRAELDRYLDDRGTATPFRPAIEAVRRRYDTTAAPPVVSKIVITPVEQEPPRAGKPAPDFTAADVTKPTGRTRLSAHLGKPVVVVFYKPGSVTSVETLAICEALHRQYADAVAVVPLAVGKPTRAAEQRATLKLTVPVFDGGEVRAAYAVESYPQFFVSDQKGLLRWAFDAGVGPEVGYLVKQEVDKLLK